MIHYKSLTQRPHLIVSILVAIIVLLLLTLAAAKMLRDDEAIEDTTPAPIETPQSGKIQ